MYAKIIKPLFDFLAAFIGILLCSPVLIIIWLVLAILNKGKVLFIQQRPGKHGKPFNTFKFKTMNDKRDTNGELLPDYMRITAFGNFMRKSSLDELPQLFNVLIGELSLIGPRPLLMEYLPLYSKEQNRRHMMKPGITGWAQVNGRNAISWEKKFELDVWYVDNCSFLLDIKILFLTIGKLISSSNVNASEHLTMERFTGNNK